MKAALMIDVPKGMVPVLGRDAPNPMPNGSLRWGPSGDHEDRSGYSVDDLAPLGIYLIPTWPPKPTQEMLDEWNMDVDGDKPVRVDPEGNYFYVSRTGTSMFHVSEFVGVKCFGGLRWRLKPRKPKTRPWNRQEWEDHIGAVMRDRRGVLLCLGGLDEVRIGGSSYPMEDYGWRWPGESEWKPCTVEVK